MPDYIEKESAVRELVMDYAYAAAEMVERMPAADVVSGEMFRCQEEELKEASARINQAYWVAWARDFQEPGTLGNERLHAALQDVMLALKGQIQARPERDRLKKKLEKMKYAEETAGDGEAQREVERLKKELAMADPVVAEFKGLFEQASVLVAKLLGMVDCAPKGKQKNLRDALDALGRQLEVQG